MSLTTRIQASKQARQVNTKDLIKRIAKAKGVMAGFNNICKSKQSHKTKLSILKTCVFSTALYASEAWMLKKTDRDKILAFEMYCYRRLLQINWTQKVTNENIRKRLNIKKRFNASSDEKEVVIIWTCMQDEK